MRDGSAEPTALLPLHAESCRNECIQCRSVVMIGVIAVSGYRAVHEPRVERSQRRGINAQLGRHVGRIGRDDDIGAPHVIERDRAIGKVDEIENGAPPPAQPRVGTGQRPEGVAPWWLDLQYLGTVVGQQHAGDRPRDARREVDHSQSR